MDEILISIIMPVHNEEAYVQEAISSILEQSFSALELIVVNDASTDRSDVLIRSFVDSRLVYVSNPIRTGNYSCRNQGAKLARGKYMAVMDADDVALPERLNKQYRYLEEHPDVIAVGAGCIFIPQDSPKTTLHTYEEILLGLLTDNTFVHSSLMYRAEVFRSLGGYDETYYYSADYDLACRLALTGPVVNLRDALIYYRWHPKQISQKHVAEQADFAEKIRKKYCQNFINYFKDDAQAEADYPDVAVAWMGRIIALYTYARHSADMACLQFAENELDRLLSSLSTNAPCRLDNGILGLACGIVYLLRNGFVEGDENEVLESIDELFLMHLANHPDADKIDRYGCLHYFRLRLSSVSWGQANRKYLEFRQSLIYLFDCLMRSCRKGLRLSGQELDEISWFHRQKYCPVITGKLLGFSRQETDKQITPMAMQGKVSFLIPLRVDSEERSRNLDAVLEKLCEIGEADIWVLEADKTPCYQLKIKSSRIHYMFVEDADPVFHRTRYLNRLLHETDADIVGIWDTDVILPENQICTAVEAIKAGKAVMAFPYDGFFCMLNPKISDSYRNEPTISVLEDNFKKRSNLWCFYSVGGAFLVNRKRYLQAGGENEFFYGWGPEDVERVKRMEILDMPIYRSPGALYHLYHPRKENSCYSSNEGIEFQNRREFLKVCSMTKEELSAYIHTWTSTKSFDEDCQM